jgi:hypothetical protein
MKKKKIIFVYIIFTFMLTSFADCEKLKNSPVSGLNQSDASASSKANSQSEKGEPVKSTPLPPKPSAPPETKAVNTVEKEVAVEKKNYTILDGCERLLERTEDSIVGIVSGSGDSVNERGYWFGDASEYAKSKRQHEHARWQLVGIAEAGVVIGLENGSINE